MAMRSSLATIAAALSLLFSWNTTAQAQNRLGADQGKLLLTAGFSDFEGAGGGGLVPLAFITGYGTSDSWGANAHLTAIHLGDLDLRTYGAAVGALDRFELSYTRHELDITGTALDGLGVTQDVYGVKLKLFGNAVYLQDSWLPQTAVGAQFKKNRGIDDAASVGLAGLTTPIQLGAEDDEGTDYYLSATKVLLGQSLVFNLTLRYTEANQFGLLGFGGDLESGASLEPEGTVAYLLTRRLALGAEYRSKPRNLTVDTEESAWTVFAAWAPNRNISLVAAYLNIGSVLAPVTTETADQAGPYVSIQIGF
jgi:hypothetical protein